MNIIPAIKFYASQILVIALRVNSLKYNEESKDKIYQYYNISCNAYNINHINKFKLNKSEYNFFKFLRAFDLPHNTTFPFLSGHWSANSCYFKRPNM